MDVSIITPNKNGAGFLEQTILSVLAQRSDGIDLEYIIQDGGSTDGSLDIIRRYQGAINSVTSEPDHGPGWAINKGLSLAKGEVVAWLNADDVYHPGALRRALQTLADNPKAAFCFGSCRIIDEHGREIRRGITRFKELLYPLSSRFTFQCINYISQPAMLFRRNALERTGLLREDMRAAFDYEFMLRLWRQGQAIRVHGAPLADFRWHQGSISAHHFYIQFREELQAVVEDAGPLAAQTLIHHGVRWGITGIYALLALQRRCGRT